MELGQIIKFPSSIVRELPRSLCTSELRGLGLGQKCRNSSKVWEVSGNPARNLDKSGGAGTVQDEMVCRQPAQRPCRTWESGAV